MLIRRRTTIIIKLTPPLPLHHPLIRRLVELRRIIEDEVEKRHPILHPPRIVQNLVEEGEVVDRHLVLDRVGHEAHRKLPVREVVPVAHVLAPRVGRPDTEPRGGRRVEEAEFAVEEELGEAGPRGHGAVVVGEAVGVGVPVG